MRTNENNVIDLFPENKIKQTNNTETLDTGEGTQSIEELRNHVRQQLSDLHSIENKTEKNEQKDQIEVLTKLEKELHQRLVREKLKNQFDNWLKKPLWGKEEKMIHIFGKKEDSLKKAA